MKKYFLIGLIVAIVPSICLGQSTRYTQLVREKQRKMEELEKCMGASKGLQIAGLSTLGLTAVGVAGNIAEAQKRDSYEADMKSIEKKIKKLDDEIAEENEKKELIKQAEMEAKRQAELRADIIDVTNQEIEKTVQSKEFQEYLAQFDDGKNENVDEEIELIEEEASDDDDEVFLQYACTHNNTGTKWENGTCVCEKPNQTLQGNKCVDNKK